MSKNARDRRPYIRPVTRIELPEGNIKLRMILIVVLLSIAVVAVVFGLVSALKTEPGWQEVEVTSSELNCSRDFVLMYEFGMDGLDATSEYRNVTRMYTELTEFAFRIFSADTEVENLGNVWYLNRHPNEEVAVAHELYQALELVTEYDSRYLFLGPVYDVYDPVFLAETSAEAALYDPAREPELAAYVQETMQYCADPNRIRLELLGEDRVKLHISEDYLAYAQENGIETFLDFGWMTNAFVADYMADTLAVSGYTNGYLASYDGFTRNLDERGNGYSYNLFDRQEQDIYMPGRLNYDRPMSIVFLRNYPLSEQDQWHYHAYEDGQITSVMVDTADGAVKSATDNLVVYSSGIGCAELLLKAAPVFISEELDIQALHEWTQDGIGSIWGEGGNLCYNDEDAQLELLPESGGAEYALKQVK